jgi:uncharacterized protein (TIGR03067 family)
VAVVFQVRRLYAAWNRLPAVEEEDGHAIIVALAIIPMTSLVRSSPRSLFVWRFSMKLYALLVVAVAAFVVGAGVLTAGGDAKEEAIKKDRKQIAGTWRVISYEKDGKKTPAEQLEKTRTIYSADGKFMVQREGKTVVAGSTEIDPTKKPKQSEATYTEGELKGKTVLAIYEIDGDSMRGCYALPGKERPTEFSSKAGSGHVLITYKRDKP